MIFLKAFYLLILNKFPNFWKNFTPVIKWFKIRISKKRNKKILVHINKAGLGLEVGPSHDPVCPKRDGWNIKILDHASAEELRAKYKDHEVNLDSIEDVDYIWTGNRFRDIIPDDIYFDWIVVSHVIEHTPDLLGFLLDCSSLLKPDGVLSLAVPDKRYCFDVFRERSSLSQIIDAHLNETKNHTIGTVAEYCLRVSRKNNVISWGKYWGGKYSLLHTVDSTLQTIDTLRAGEYFDLHAWCFTPNHFRLLLLELKELNFLDLNEISYFDTDGSEFFISLRKSAGKGKMDRLKLAQLANSEI